MPKEITHWLIAEEIVATLGQTSRLKKIITEYKHLYLVGAVLPDSLLYLKHGKDATTVIKKAEEIDNAPDSYFFIKNYFDTKIGRLTDAELSLLAGIVIHFFTDSVFHPFIYYFGGMNNANHFILETYADLYFKGESKPTHKWLFRNILSSCEIASEQLIETVYTIFFEPKSIEKKSIQRMLNLHAFIQAQFNNPFSRFILQVINKLPGIHMDEKVALFYPATKPKPGTFFNKKYEYEHPVTGETHLAGLEDLKKQVVKKGVSFFTSFFSKNPFHKEAFNALHDNANTGLPGKTLKDMRFFSEEADVMNVIL